MKYLAVFDDSVLDDFENSLDLDGIFIKLMNKRKKEVTVRLKPLIMPIVTVDENTGSDKLNTMYLNEGHIEALLTYEREQTLKMISNDFLDSLNGINNIAFRKGDDHEIQEE